MRSRDFLYTPYLLLYCTYFNARRRRGWGGTISIPEAAFALYVCRQVDSTLADDFFERLLDGAGISEQHPAYVLRERLLKNYRDKRQKKLDLSEKLAFYFKAFSALHRGRAITRLQWRDDELFPFIWDAPAWEDRPTGDADEDGEAG